MSRVIPKGMNDGFQVINLGVNSGVAPNTLTRTQLAWAVNTTFRGDFPKNRPGWKKIDLQFLDENRSVDTTLRDNFEDNLFQGAVAFERRNQLVLSIGGRMFAIRLQDYLVSDISISGDLDRSDLRKAWMVEAEDFIIRQDGQNAALIYDGSSSRRAKPDLFEVPAGTVMSYSQGRLWVAMPDRRSFVASDLVYGPSGNPEFQRRDAILKFTENEFLNGGGAFAVPFNAGAITAMNSIAQLDNVTGHGPLQVFTERGVFSVNAPAQRDQWQNLRSPIQTVSLLGSGALNDWSTVNVNGDLWYRGTDGVRSFQLARRDFGQWINSPLSREVERRTEVDDEDFLNYSSAALFDNRLLMTAGPCLDWNHGTVHPELLSLDFNPISRIGGGGSPRWEGVWDGLKVLQLVSGTFQGVTRLFAVTLSDDGDKDIELWELTKDDEFDFDGTQDVRIEWVLETPSMNFEDGGWNLKSLETGDVWYDNLAGDVDFVVEYRPDQEPDWQSWTNWSSTAQWETCETADDTGCVTVECLSKQYRARKKFPLPSDACDSTAGKPYRFGYEFQAKLTITGAARIKKFRITALDRPEPTAGSCESTF